MKIQTTSSAIVHLPVETVFTRIACTDFIQSWLAPFKAEHYVVDNQNQHVNTTHTTDVPAIRQITEGAISIGTTFLQQTNLSPRAMQAKLEVTEYAFPSAFALRVTAPLALSSHRFTFEVVSVGTKLTHVQEARPLNWYFRLAFFVMQSSMVKRGEDQMNAVKKYLEELG